MSDYAVKEGDKKEPRQKHSPISQRNTSKPENFMMPGYTGIPVQLSTINGCSPVVQRSIGFEFQMIQSDVELLNYMPKEGIKKKYAAQIPMTCGGSIIIDGMDTSENHGNLEMKTNKPLNTENDVTKTVSEMAKIGDQMSKASENSFIGYENKFIHVIKSDSFAQPQVNFDLPLSKMDEQFGERIHTLLNSKNPDFFGAQTFQNWDPHLNQIVLNEILQFTKQVNTSGILPFIPNEWLSADNKKLNDTFIRLLNNYSILLFTQAHQFSNVGSPLEKDIPMLIKTSFTDIKEKIINTVPNTAGKLEIAPLLDNMVIKFITNTATTCKLNNTRVKFTQSKLDQLEREGNQAPLNDLYGKKQRLNGDSVLAELRRIKEYPHNEWVPFSVNAFRIVHNWAPGAN